MASFTKVAIVADVPEGTGKVIEVGGKTLALFNADGKFYAIDNTCKHRGGPLGEGELVGLEVTCPWHGWSYNITTGENLDDATVKVGCYPVRLEGTDVLVEV